MAKRTLDTFFKPTATNKRPKSSTIENSQPTNPPSSHPTYPFPIASLPSHIEVNLTHGTPALPPRTINNQPDLDLLYFQPYITRDTANELFHFLRRELPFYRVQYQIRRGGVSTQINTPRFTTVFGVDDTAVFARADSVSTSTSTSGSAQTQTQTTTSSQPATQPLNHTNQDLILINPGTKSPIPASKYTYPPRPIPSCLDILRQQVEAATGARYNFCLVNYYASGEDSISFHSDDERFLGPEPNIASLSLGGEREFQMKHKPVPVPVPVPGPALVPGNTRTSMNEKHSDENGKVQVQPDPADHHPGSEFNNRSDGDSRVSDNSGAGETSVGGAGVEVHQTTEPERTYSDRGVDAALPLSSKSNSMSQARSGTGGPVAGASDCQLGVGQAQARRVGCKTRATLSLNGKQPKAENSTTTGRTVATLPGNTKAGAATQTLKMPLASGDMVVMRGRTQANWLHSIPKRRGRAGEAVRGRINITFRRAVVPGGTNNYYNYNVGGGGVYRWDEEKQRMELMSSS